MFSDDPFAPSCGGIASEARDPLTDFLFIMKISLLVALSFFAAKEVSERFALAESKGLPREIQPDEYKELLQVKMTDEEDAVVWIGDKPISTTDELNAWVAQQEPRKVLFTPARNRTFGEVEEVKHIFKSAGFDLLIEFQRTEN